MVRKSLTEKEVIIAATVIGASGEMPTIAGVRQYVGGRGSETTILNYLNKWKRNLLKGALPDVILILNQENSKLRQETKDLKHHISEVRAELESMRSLIEDQEAS